ncbi:MAG: hypothetical protein WCO22_12155 [Betaproteobacteria bacterium]
MIIANRKNDVLRAASLLLLLLLSGLPAWACAICAPVDGRGTLSQALRQADTVVLASPVAGGAGLAVRQLIKGAPPQGLIRLPASEPRPLPVEPTALSQLLYHQGSAGWQSAGPLDASRADWLRQLLALSPVTDGSAPDWDRRLAFFVMDLESPEPLVAQAAYEEIAVAPYGEMRRLRGRLRAAWLLDWLDTPRLAARRPLYALLLGVSGEPERAPALQQRLARLRQPADAAVLSAMLAAWLELQGESGVAWLEQHYLQAPGLQEWEYQAALLALSVHGNDGQRVSRARVVKAYADFVRQDTPLAGWVASDLGNWGRWEFDQRYAALLRSGRPQTFASRYAMVFYLMRNPKPQARALLDALRAEGAL